MRKVGREIEKMEMEMKRKGEETKKMRRIEKEETRKKRKKEKR